MQIEFREKPVRCMRELVVEVLYQEETAELIVPDIYPDVRAVVDASAICCLRDQEVTNGSFSAAGAFQTTVLFTAEETGEVCVQDAWLPFSVRMNRDEIVSGSFGMADLRIRSVDARILNSRKLLVRVSYAIRVSAQLLIVIIREFVGKREFLCLKIHRSELIRHYFKCSLVVFVC